MKKLWNVICTCFAAPYEGVYDYLTENIENEVLATVLYFIWCVTFGVIYYFGVVLLWAMIYAKFHGGDEIE